MLNIQLKPREDRRLRAGHLWVYSNEIVAPPNFAKLTPGTLCRVLDARAKPLGTGYINPHTLICLRLLTGDITAEIDADWFARRLNAALALRARLYPTPHYRLVFGEADGLPGLVIDRYDDVLAVQITTAGMELLKPALLEALKIVLKPRGILISNDLAMRETEGLPQIDEVIGEVPDEIAIIESGLHFRVPLAGGQKTGWFYDQRHNRDRFAAYARGGRLLDVFSYAGGWALRGLQAGASAAICLDSSAPALAAAQASAKSNDLTVETRQGEAMDLLRELKAEGQRFETVVVDPPALIKRKRDHEKGLEHYAALNRAAMQVMSADGILIACSCSHHLEPAELQRVLLREARKLDRRLQILETGAQGADHPVHPAIPETRYLKALVARVF
ncbi:MAG: class I SAM-dependent rRNA methyltransferase [Polycyclovorans sp.]|nr:class I SAM-dependent rRNA methyltransferase [Polycyclovorans sp.]